jgi:hypothetical protein
MRCNDRVDAIGRAPYKPEQGNFPSMRRTTMKYLIPALCLGFMIGIGTGTASAQYNATTPAPAGTKGETPAKKEAKPRSAKSLECSKKADEKGLHGKERQKFRSKCKAEK